MRQLQRFVAIAQTLEVAIMDNHERHECVLEKCPPSMLGAILVKTAMDNCGHWAGRVMANLLYAAGDYGATQPRVLETGQRPTGDYTLVTVSRQNSIAPLLKVYQVRGTYGSSLSNPVFSGYLQEMVVWLQRLENEGNIVGKTVVFRYLKGSRVGNRVVEVQEVRRLHGRPYLLGKDLQQEGAIRQYDLENIDGEILVLDGVKSA